MNTGDRDFFLEEELQASGGTPRQDEGPRIARLPQSDIWQDFDREATAWANGTEPGSFADTAHDWTSNTVGPQWQSASMSAGISGKPMAPVRIPSNGQGVQHTPSGGTPMSTPPSAQGMTAQLPFVDGGPEGLLGGSMPEYSEGSLPSDASGFAQFAKQHSEQQQRLQQSQRLQEATDSFKGFDRQTSFKTPSADFLHGGSAPAMFASQMAKEQLHADAQQRKFERRVSLGNEAAEAVVPTMPVSLGEIPGRLVDLGRPPLAPRHPNFAGTQFVQTPPTPPKDTSVVDHAVAGDLMLGKKMHTMSRARTRRRSSRQSAGSGRSRKSAANSDLQFEVDSDAEHVKWFKNRRFWTVVASILITELLLISAVVMVVRYRHYKVIWFEWWRWLFFFSVVMPAGFFPIYWFSRALIHLLVITVESTAFTTKKAVYYTVGTRKPLRRFVRVALLIPLFVGCFYSKDNTNNHVRNVFRTLARLMGCLLLFFFANVLKTFVAKIMASHFHKEAHFEKMQEALQKEYFLIALSQPRQEEDSSCSSSSEDSEGEAPNAVGGTDSPAVRMMRKSMMFQQEQKQIREEAITQKRRTFRLPRFLHFRHHHRRQRSRFADKPEFRRVASRDLPDGVLFDEYETMSAPATATANGHHRSALEDLQHVPTSQQLPAPPTPPPRSARTLHNSPTRAAGANLSFKSQRNGYDNLKTTEPMKSFKHSPSKLAGSSPGRPSQDGDRSMMAKMKRSITLLGGRAGSESGMTDRSTKSLVKSHLDAIPEDRKAVDKGGGNAVQKLHEVEKYLRKNKLKVSFADTLGAAKHSDDNEVNSKNEAKKLAFYLFWNIKPSFNRTYIMPEDLEHFLEPEKAQQAFDVLDVDGDGQVTLHNIRDAVVNIYQERKHLAFTLKDTKTVVGKLENIIGFVIHALMIFFYLVIFDVNVTHLWTLVAAFLVSFSFVFKSVMSSMFDSVIFMFVVHPYDVGDAILVNGDLYKVEEIALNNTVLKRSDGCRVWYPNSMMNVQPVLNVSRSDNRWEFFKVFLDIGLPNSVYETIRTEIMKFLEENPKNYSGKGQVVNASAGDPLKVQLGVFFEYAHCGVDVARMGDDRHRLFCKIADVLCTQRVQYTFPGFSTPARPAGGGNDPGLPPRPPGPLPSPDQPRSLPLGSGSGAGAGWAALRKRTGLGSAATSKPEVPGGPWGQQSSSSQPGPSPHWPGGVPQALQEGGLKRGFGSHVALSTLEESDQSQQEQQQQQQQQDVLTAQQVALKRGAGSSGDGSSAVPATIPRLMQQPT